MSRKLGLQDTEYDPEIHTSEVDFDFFLKESSQRNKENDAYEEQSQKHDDAFYRDDMAASTSADYTTAHDSTLNFLDKERSELLLSDDSLSDSTVTSISDSDITEISPMSSASVSPLPSFSPARLSPSPRVAPYRRYLTVSKPSGSERLKGAEKDQSPHCDMKLLVKALHDLERHKSAPNFPLEPRIEKPERKNMSFTNEEVRQIDRSNHILLRKILERQGTKIKVKPKTLVPKPPSSAICRMKQQRKITQENLILLRKIQEAKPSKEVSEAFGLKSKQLPPSHTNAHMRVHSVSGTPKSVMQPSTSKSVH